jgi:hypothetical protein
MTILVQNKLRTLAHRLDRRKVKVDKELFGERVGFMGKIFGCSHQNISRPFTHGKISYRCCLQCGARKQFDPETLETFGGFYYPPLVR